MKINLGRTVVLVTDYDKAFEFYHANFGFEKIFDQTAPDGSRYLHVGIPNDKCGIWFMKPAGPSQEACVGNQTGGQPTLVLYTDDAQRLFSKLEANNVQMASELVRADGSQFFHCLDLYGNRITIVQMDRS